MQCIFRSQSNKQISYNHSSEQSQQNTPHSIVAPHKICYNRISLFSHKE
nr:MAG TPA: hypothetical protein [Caudoviricetes sp.]